MAKTRVNTSALSIWRGREGSGSRRNRWTLVGRPRGTRESVRGWAARFFFFSSTRRHTRYWRDWSSDLCSSDLGDIAWLTGGAAENEGPDDGEGGDFGFSDFVAGIDALVMGRATYDVIAPFDEWPYQGKPVHVLSSTLEPGADDRITVHRSFVEAVAALNAAGYPREDASQRAGGGPVRCGRLGYSPEGGKTETVN